jgi:hypothetical protein
MKAIFPVIALGLAACVADGAGPGAGRGRVALAVSAQRPTASAGASLLAAGDSTVLAADSDTVIVRTVDLVVRRIELKPVEVAACESDSSAVEHEGEHHDSTAGDDSTAERDQEGCEEIKAGPVLVSLPLGDTAVAALVNVSAPAGQYDKLEFKIHAPRLPRDSAFLAANPDFAGVSIRVTGTFSDHGTRSDFTFESALEAEQEVRIDPPLAVGDSAVASVTLRFDLSGWFAGAGSGLVDPGTANAGGANEALVRENIQRSINAFEDRDHDGHDDGDSGDDHDGGHGEDGHGGH